MSCVKIPNPLISCSSSLSNLILSGSVLSYFFFSSALAGMNAGRSLVSRCLGTATCNLFATASIRDPRIFWSTRWARRRSHAASRTPMTPSSVIVDEETVWIPGWLMISSTNALFSGVRSSYRAISILLKTTMTGFSLNKG